MQEYDDLVQFRADVNDLYEIIKILQIFVETTHEDITLTISEQICEIIDKIDMCLDSHKKLESKVLKKNSFENKRKKLVDFNDIKENLKDIKTCLTFLKIGIESTREVSYNDIYDLLKIVLKVSKDIIDLANKTKLKIYPNERCIIYSSAKKSDFTGSKYIPAAGLKIRSII